ncbi:MAG: MBL fold metallo-hydrolase, partial [Planctomycetota bacterium]
MKVEFLGTGGYHPDAHRQTTCVLLPDRGLCFDAGSAFYRVPGRLEAYGVTELDLVLTHAHLDHVVGLTFPLVHIEEGRLTAVRIHGRKEKLDAVREHLFSQAIFPVMPRIFEWLPLPETECGSLEVAGGTLHFREQKHPGGSLGLRFEADARRFAFCTDTSP